MFPQVIVMAAGFGRVMWRNVACMIGVEGRSMHNVENAGLTYWAPNVNVWRDPRWGRGQETPGEDPRVVGEFAVEYVMGFQGGGEAGGGKEVLLEDRGGGDDGGGGGRLMLSACCKHFVAYDLEKWGSFSSIGKHSLRNKGKTARISPSTDPLQYRSTWVTDYDMEDTYLPPFKSCIQDGKASCLIYSYNSVNGIPACAAGNLLKIARTQWGFQGYEVPLVPTLLFGDMMCFMFYACSDFLYAQLQIYYLREYQHYTKSKEDAVADALKAGP
ncbi:putative beta-D-xylosidase 6 [Drosera capensis]